MADNPEKKQSWWLTLPGILTAITGFIGAIGSLVVVLNQVGLLSGNVSPTNTSAPPALVNPARPPSGVPLIGLPAVDADWQGFPAPSWARCQNDDAAAAIGLTTRSKLVVCRRAPTDFYYRGLANNSATGIELDAVRSSGGFDVTNPSDGTKYQIRPDNLTIAMPGKAPWSEPMLQYASS